MSTLTHNIWSCYVKLSALILPNQIFPTFLEYFTMNGKYSNQFKEQFRSALCVHLHTLAILLIISTILSAVVQYERS